MRRAIPILLSLLIFLMVVMTSGHRSRGHPAMPDLRPSTGAASKADGDDEARVIVRSVDIVPSDRPGGHIDAIQGSPSMMHHAWVVTFDVAAELRGRFDRREMRILVHSPSRDLGVREKGQRGVLHRYRSRAGRRYEFTPD